ncbi:regulator of protease activity HflC (stomatin/prohibitin superfamily) [Methylopila capsulata]|uniref:Regulator of protease activity HflC (Stomatin/prohibitin superfamily) n=1 Tax=Methylopila capsulata TaxID=61654 RepID=A0A9W6IWG1_9HYPH|nr:hypothetical protein [Methylopila capsulata]MBM7852678.1 regulator of protease activity HflC (stomatin/prohibitin superfamily) [Methylopila capsulata]GLK56887.1 hypothetical protein GCM10008170_29060 [Methylopila capsulata]
MPENTKQVSDAQAKKRADRQTAKARARKLAADPKAAAQAQKLADKEAIKKAKRLDRKVAKIANAAADEAG